MLGSKKLATLYDLCELCGISGDEGRVSEYILHHLETIPNIESVTVDPLGNILVHKLGTQAHTVGRRLLLSAHMDEVGMIVTSIRADGTLTIAPVGGVNANVAIGRQVLVGERMGVVGVTPVHRLSQKQRDTLPKWEDLYVDIGALSRAEAEEHVTLGDSVYFHAPYMPFGEGRIAAKAIDDRFGCAVLLDLLQECFETDLWVSFVVQEEVGLRGARVASYTINPDIAIVIEATTAADLDNVHDGSAVCRLGEGAVISFMDSATIYNKDLYRQAFAKARELGIPAQTKSRIAGGNDAGAIHISRGGVRTLAISVPCRGLHSPSCVADSRDMLSVRELVIALAKDIATP